jgi:hypothetical protein
MLGECYLYDCDDEFAVPFALSNHIRALAHSIGIIMR